MLSDAAAIGDLYDGESFTKQEQPSPLNENIDEERVRRSTAGFVWNGKQYDFDGDSRDRISAAGTLALGAMVGGRQLGDLGWANDDTDFAWIAADNTATTMDAQSCFAFASAAAAHEGAHVFAGRTLKDKDPIPGDYEDDKYWP